MNLALFSLVFLFGTVCLMEAAPDDATVDKKAAPAVQLVAENLRGTWRPREAVYGWGADRHAPALRIRDGDRAAPARHRSSWKAWRKKFGARRTFHNSSHEELHARIYEESEAMVDENRIAYANGLASYELALNEFADQTQEEAASRVMSKEAVAARKNFYPDPKALIQPAESRTRVKRAPAHVDWRNTITFNPPKDQKACGGCYAFGTLAAVEAAIFLAKGETVNLAEQQIVDCTFGIDGEMNGGCDGGHEVTTLDYLVTQEKLIRTEQYNYTSGGSQRHHSCQRNPPPTNPANKKVYNGNGITYRGIRPGDEVAVRDGIATTGPTVSSISGENRDFQMLRGGIYNNPGCPKDVDHVISIIGYGTEGGRDYWIVRNSWGPGWGVNGYGKVARGVNQCGIASDYSWVILFA